MDLDHFRSIVGVLGMDLGHFETNLGVLGIDLAHFGGLGHDFRLCWAFWTWICTDVWLDVWLDFIVQLTYS